MSKRTWLLIRGLAHEHEHWGEFRDMLESHYPDDEFFGVDLPGTGVHHKETAPISLVETLKIIRENTLQQVKPPFLIISLSFGSMIAIEWAKRYPHEIEGLVLMNTSIGRYSPFYYRLRLKMWKEYMQRLTATDPVEIEKIILSIISSKTDGLDEIAKKRAEIQKHRPVSLKNILRQLLAAATYQSDGNPPPVPTLLLAGEADKLCDPSCSIEIAHEWNLPLRVHHTAGHDLSLDEPEWVIDKISHWVV